MALKARRAVPDLDLPLAGGDRFRLSAADPEHFSLIVVYRGLHCPVCRIQLRELERKLPDFLELGVEPIAVSSDPRERAERVKAEWELRYLPVAYGMSIEEGRAWGLHASRAISEREPAEFLEPGLFLVRPDRTLYAASVQTMPFARPHLSDVLGAARLAIESDYPARGEG